nr:hypothetical protein [Mycoplasmopsis bovis]
MKRIIGIPSNAKINDNYWNRVMASWYGYQYNINFSSLYYGASGSLAYNEFGQMIGIYNAVSAQSWLWRLASCQARNCSILTI